MCDSLLLTLSNYPSDTNNTEDAILLNKLACHSPSVYVRPTPNFAAFFIFSSPIIPFRDLSLKNDLLALGQRGRREGIGPNHPTLILYRRQDLARQYIPHRPERDY